MGAVHQWLEATSAGAPRARPSVVVMTPVRNEAWILERFLAVTSAFADAIIVADQGSTDASVEICRSYSKVTVVTNPSDAYDEAARQRLLLRTARVVVGGPKVILALDADEILAADALASPDWRRMLEAAPGTVVCLEKLDLFGSTARCIRYAKPWPLGYVDDGAEHEGRMIHSIRVPTRPEAPRLELAHAKVLHYTLTRPDAQAAKIRMYSAIENVLGVQPLRRRRAAYAAARDWTRDGRLEDVRPQWFEGWSAAGIDMHTILTEPFYWYDLAVLRLFREHGERRFHLDDIWEIDWEACRRHFLQSHPGDVPGSPVRGPGRLRRTGVRLIDECHRVARALRRR